MNTSNLISRPEYHGINLRVFLHIKGSSPPTSNGKSIDLWEDTWIPLEYFQPTHWAVLQNIFRGIVSGLEHKYHTLQHQITLDQSTTNAAATTSTVDANEAAPDSMIGFTLRGEAAMGMPFAPLWMLRNYLTCACGGPPPHKCGVLCMCGAPSRSNLRRKKGFGKGSKFGLNGYEKECALQIEVKYMDSPSSSPLPAPLGQRSGGAATAMNVDPMSAAEVTTEAGTTATASASIQADLLEEKAKVQGSDEASAVPTMLPSAPSSMQQQISNHRTWNPVLFADIAAGTQ
jgi:hypothetical protein